MQIDEKIIIKIYEAQADVIKMDELIEAYMPFILKELSGNTGKYIDVSNDSALTVGMMAFREAVENYDSEKGSFISFASLLIKRRHIDYLRKESKYTDKNQSLDNESMDMNKKSAQLYADELEVLARKAEINEFKELLLNYNIDFSDLVRHSPKKKILRILYKEIAAFITSQDLLQKIVIEQGKLPIKEILVKYNVNRKKVERGRIYILSIVLLSSSNLNILKAYIEGSD